MEETAKQIMGRVPKPLPLSDIMEQYPVKYEESMNTVLVQEVYIQYKHKSMISIQVYVCCQSIGLLYLVGNIASHVMLLEMFWTQLLRQSYTCFKNGTAQALCSHLVILIDFLL